MENKKSTITDVKKNVQEYYGQDLKKTTDLKTNACCAPDAVPGYVSQILPEVHQEVQDKYYGCGTAFPDGLEGLTILDVGCGTGRDVFLLSRLVGEQGFVYGIDMTEQQLEIAEKHVEYHRTRYGYKQSNVRFIHDYMEKMDKHIQPGTLDLVTSNCVINLAENKEVVLEKIYSLLKPGGELYFSDVYADRRLPQDVREHKVLWGECLGGALYQQDFVRIARRIGFKDPRIVTAGKIEITNQEIQQLVGTAHFSSVTYRLWKLEGLEDAYEDYGHIAVYKGGFPNMEHRFTLDKEHVFEKNKSERVCGNTARMLSETRLHPYFEVIGNFNEHFGAFTSCETIANNDTQQSSKSACNC